MIGPAMSFHSIVEGGDKLNKPRLWWFISLLERKIRDGKIKKAMERWWSVWTSWEDVTFFTTIIWLGG